MSESNGTGFSVHAMAVGLLFALIGLVGVAYGYGQWHAPELASNHGAGKVRPHRPDAHRRRHQPNGDRPVGSGVDDIVSINHLYLPADEMVHLVLRARDVIHSLFLPNFRVKQDAVPGMTIDVMFTATRLECWATPVGVGLQPRGKAGAGGELPPPLLVSRLPRGKASRNRAFPPTRSRRVLPVFAPNCLQAR